MILENQVVSLELAKKLKELGFKQESLFWWQKFSLSNKPKVFLGQCETLNGLKEYSISAYTVAELGEMLPRSISDKGRCYFLRSKPEFENNGWACQYTTSTGLTLHFEEAPIEADARAKMLIYLKENNLLEGK